MKKHKTIRILPFRVYEGHLEILLLKHIQKLKAFNEDINAIELFSDPSPIFSAARIFSEIFLGMKWNLDEKNINWNSVEFRKILGLFCLAENTYHTDRSITFFIHTPKLLSKYQGHTNKNYSFCWHTISEIQLKPTKFSPNLTIFLYYEVGGLQKFLDLNSEPKKYYGILNTEPDETWENVYEACYQGYFQKTNEKWTSYKVFKNQFPSEDQIEKTKGWIITGSNSATYHLDNWKLKLFDLIRKLSRKKVKILGFCFGHQSIAVALGGKVERMPALKDNLMLMYKNRIFLTEDFVNMDYFRNSRAFRKVNLKRGIFLNQAHGDYVSVLPKNAKHFGYSDDIHCEIMGIGSKILSMQSHPEFSESMMIYRWLPEILQNDARFEKYRKSCIQSYFLGELHYREMQLVCENFLKNNEHSSDIEENHLEIIEEASLFQEMEKKSGILNLNNEFINLNIEKMKENNLVSNFHQ